MATENKIYSLQDAIQQVKSWQNKDEEVVFTNGCFDILHLGHVDYLEKSALKGSKFIVAVNEDLSIKRLKGPERPVNNEYARARLIAALGFVDMVVLFGEDTPYDVIKSLQPDVLVKGDDYMAEVTDKNNPKYIVGSDIVRNKGGRVETISLVEGYSTTNIINKVKK